MCGFNFSKTFVVIRLLPDGRLDSTFNENGVADLILEQADRFSADLEDIAVQSDGKILAAGSAGSSSDHMIIARFKSDGSIDSAFGEKTGYSILPMASGLSKAYNVYSTNNNSITLTGYYNTGVSTQDFGVVKYNIDGIIDSSFGVNGIATTSFDDLDTYYIGYSSALQPDGKIILGSAVDLTGRGDEENIALVRFNGGKLHSQPDFAKIQKWQGHYGFTWNEWPGNKTTYYSVGRSANAGIFTEIAQVPDITEEKKYKYEDPAPPAGIVYYQLTAVRSDGKKVSSNIIAAGNVVATIKLFPNPAKNSLRIEGLPAEQTTKFTIIDLSGNTKIFSTSAGSSHTFNIAQLKPGNYMLRLETNGNVANRMFVKE
ncbi:MAG TPA: T9SS type A sorting domain-containing protein [Panacibacter sp.]|nr:T9SS type A sorting domain-containing protein [Panacibacter sp.]